MGIGLLVYGVVGLVLLVVVWPTERSARNLLRAWRVAEPTPEQTADAWSYLRKRRFWYPWIFLFIPLLFERYRWTDGLYQYVVPIMAGLLIAEVAALRPRRDRLRTAALSRRRVFDLVPRWAVVCHAVLVLVTACYALVGIVAQPRVTEQAGAYLPEGGQVGRELVLSNGSRSWTVLIGTVVALMAVIAVVWLAMVRPVGADVVVDGVLRTRSSRVALGLGIGLQGSLLPLASLRIDDLVRYGAPRWVEAAHWSSASIVLVGAVGSTLAWVWVANPPLRRPYFARAR